MSELWSVGKSSARVDALEKVTGAAVFSSDVLDHLTRTFHAKVLRSAHPHARIIAIDTSKADRIPGVVAVLTGKDGPDRRYGSAVADQYVLARDVVRFVGEPVAAVVARTPEIAREAVEAIEVTYEGLRASFDAEDMMAENPPAVLHPDLRDYELVDRRRLDGDRPNVSCHYRIRTGDVDRAFSEADVIVENKFSTTRMSHCQLERDCCVGEVDAQGNLTLSTSSRSIYRVKGIITRLFDLPPSKVRVINRYVGGSFGRFPKADQLTALLALKTGKRIKLEFTREEVFIGTNNRVPIVIYMKDGLNKDGTLIARQMKLVLNGGAYGDMVPRLAQTASYGAVGTYRIPNFKLDSYGVYTNEPVAATWRGVGVTQVAFAIESQMDLIAEKLGMDPAELRLKNLLKEGDKNVIGETVHSIAAEDCLKKVLDFIGRKPSAGTEGRWKVGTGFSLINKFSAGGATNSAYVKVHGDGSVEVLHSADEVGQGVNTVLAQIAAEEFAIPASSVKVFRGDTAITPYDTGSASSRSTFYTGNAVRLACQDAKRQLAEMAAAKLEIHPERLIVGAGKVVSVDNPEIGIPISRLFSEADRLHGITGRGNWKHEVTPVDVETGHGERINAFYTHGAQAVEVAVDTETGQVKVLRVGSCFDMGQPVNPKMCEQQIEGGVGMGIGSALFEEMIMSDGRVMNPNFLDYRFPTVKEMPSIGEVKSMIAFAPHNEGPYGAKGMGEAVVAPVGPALANAIYNAIGIRISDLPITPERVLKALKEK